MKLNEIINVIYDDEKSPKERFDTVKEHADKIVAKAFKDEDWDTMEEVQAHLENISMEVIRSLNEDGTLKDTLNTIFVKYGKKNKFSVSVLDKENNKLVACRIKESDNVQELKKLGFYVRRSTN